MKSEKVMIKVDNVYKSFRIPHEKNTTLKSSFFSMYKKKKYTEYKALQDISFEVKEGEFFGIVGRNGSGKSTLLKILSNIYRPDKGTVKINGGLSPFLELGVGFNPELSARDNVYLNGAILGLTRQEIDAKFEDIIKYAELEDFVDMKLKNYSSGMQVRLAFAVAIQAHAQILLIDEVLAVGDANFQEKCFHTFRQLKAEGRTIVFVTHDMSSVKEFCNRAMLINNSRVEVIGSVDKVIQRYNDLNRESFEKAIDDEETSNGSNRWGNFKVRFTDVELTDLDDEPKKLFKTGDGLKIKLKYKVKEPIKKPNFAITLYRDDGTYCYDINTDLDELSPKELVEDGSLSLSLKSLPIQKGIYFFKIAIYTDYIKETIDFIDRGPEFRVEGNNQFGLVYIDHDWDLSSLKKVK